MNKLDRHLVKGSHNNLSLYYYIFITWAWSSAVVAVTVSDTSHWLLVPMLFAILFLHWMFNSSQKDLKKKVDL